MTRLKINSSLTVHNVEETYHKWSKLIDSNSIEIDASEVVEIDTSGLQLVIFFILRVLNKQGTSLYNPTPSPYFVEQANLAGMSKILLLSQGESK